MSRDGREVAAASVTDRHGLVALYARRVDSAAVDLVPMVEQRRDGSDTPYGRPRRGFRLGAHLVPPREVGRGTREHRLARRGGREAARRQRKPMRRHDVRSLARVLGPRAGTRRKLVAAGLAALILVIGAASSGLAQERDRAQPGDTIASVAESAGIAPATILAASWVPDPANLTSDDVLILHDPARAPATAAAAHEATSPWAVNGQSRGGPSRLSLPTRSPLAGSSKGG